jgi:hypothetical protein
VIRKEVNTKGIVVSILVIAVLSLMLAAPLAAAEGAIWTDKADYAPEEIVTIFGSGFVANAEITGSVIRPTLPDPMADTWVSTSDADGNFTYVYQLDGITGTYTVTATDGTNTATVTFTDAVNLKISGKDESQHPNTGSEEDLGNVVKGTTLDTQPNNLSFLHLQHSVQLVAL